MSRDDLIRTATQRLLSLELERGTFDARATLRAPQADEAEESLTNLRSIETGDTPALAVRATLGQGGMGVVQLGVQRSIGRDVALKTLDREARTGEAIARLVREGMVTGGLEHPNIVPVYDLVLGEDDIPVLVMRLIEGSTWTACMREMPAGEGGDLLEWNVKTLMSVCQAVHFAHARGVVHRDLKPDNVMVGGFGEVYVVDWGIALRPAEPRSTTDRTEGQVVGTPVYLAPEMLLGGDVSPRTDVYQLGGILFEILTGRAPHDVPGTTRDFVASVIASKPVLPESAPPELAALVRACMAADPEERPSSAEAVRLALGEFLRHRGSAAIAARASERLQELEAALSAPRPDTDTVLRLYGEVTFGFRAATEAWAGNDAARAALATATKALVRHELVHGQVRAARVHLADLVEPDEALRTEVERANEQADAEALQDAALRRELDPRTGRRTRVALALLFGTLWTVQPLAQQAGWLGPNADSHLGGAVMAFGLIVLWGVGMVAARRAVEQSRLNRQVARIALLSLTVQLLAYVGAALLGLPAAKTQTMLLFVWFVFVMLLGALFERGFFVPAVAFLVAFFVGARVPSLRLVAESGANLVLTATVLVAWRDRER